MSRRTHKITVLLSAAALIGGVGIGAADAAKTTTAKRSASSAPAGGRHGGAIPSDALAKIATALGVSSADLKAALDASRPARPGGGMRPGGCGALAADLATALGVETSAVQTILDANRPARPATRPAEGTPPPRPDRSKLVSALASGLSVDEATVTAALDKLDVAHQAHRQARETAMYAAVAKALDKTTDEVRAAFEANRPAAPAPTS